MANCKYCIDYTCGGQGTDEENPHCGGYGQGVRYQIPRDKPKESIDLEQRIYHLERENKLLKYNLESAEIKAEQAQRMLSLVRQIESGMTDIWESDKERRWNEPPPLISNITPDTKQ